MVGMAGWNLENRGDWIRTSDLLLPKQVNTLTNYYILPDSRGKPGVGAGVSRHQCRTLPKETHPRTHPGFRGPSQQLHRAERLGFRLIDRQDR